MEIEMKLKSGVIINEMNGEYVAVAAGEAGKAFNGMIRMNETAAFIAKTLQNEIDEEGVVNALCSEYEVDVKTAEDNVRAVIAKLDSAGLIKR
jgi:hypothetical protein